MIGKCPAGGTHDHNGSNNYELHSGTNAKGQDNWRRCTKCQTLAFAGGKSLGACPAGGQHDHKGSTNCVLAINSAPKGLLSENQDNWRWCTKCQALSYAGGKALGACPAGGQHDHTNSSNYVVSFTLPAVRLRITLDRVHCGNTEDVAGADELYYVGALTSNPSDPIVHAVLTSPMSINDNQEKTINPSQNVAFEFIVPTDAMIRGGIKAYDEDFGKDWAKYGSTVTQISNAVSTGLKASQQPAAVAAGTILEWAAKGFNLFAPLDKDDLLGSIDLNISAAGPSMEEINWHFSKSGSVFNPGVSTWNYNTIIRVFRG